MNNEIDIQIRVPNQTRYLSLIGSIGEDLAAHLQEYEGDREALAYHLNLVLTEAMVNAIRHANANDPQEEVVIRITISDNELVMLVFDHGQGFDIGAIPDPTALDAGLLDEHGRGLFIMRSLMDSVHYRKVDGGNVLELRKKL
ncbi:ATP-binding protein [Trichlorobacter ammonificans]|uniref:Serine-protein kinase rsbW n=1 Tax=Trichlorobacter ammonificans TaxID=2916410 RepID=A0ABM9D767_9BACT|nr:ATP-binding protein [Trichlorobacter ammonificans]CAH2031064.1 Serine-protein kinase rsbW [Trichlorobacter ammonificans]